MFIFLRNQKDTVLLNVNQEVKALGFYIIIIRIKSDILSAHILFDFL